MSQSLVESLESRRHLHADLAVSIRSTTLPDSVLAGIASKPFIAQITVSNVNGEGHPVDKDKTASTIPVTVALRSADGNVRTIGTATAKIPNLKDGASKNVPVKISLPADLASGTYTLIASVSPPSALEDTNPNNDTTNGKTVIASPANTDLALAATSSVSGAVATGSSAIVRATLSNLGNVAAKGAATLEIISTPTNGTPTVLATLPNVKFNLLPGKSFSSKPITVKLQGSGASALDLALGVRIASATGLINDNPANNAATAATLSVQPPPPSPFTSANATVNLAGTITFKRTSRVGARGNFIELGTFTDSNGRTGKYDYRIVTAGIVRHGIVFSNDNGTPFMTGQFNSAVTIGGKTLTFSTSSAGSAGTLAALGTTFHYRFGR